MSMANLTAAVAAINALKDTFLAKVGEINAAIAAAAAGYAALSANLRGTVVDVMTCVITYDPTAPAANLVDGGIFRNWAELRTFVATMAHNARLTVMLPDGATLTTSSALGTPSTLYLRFRCVAEAPVVRPKIIFRCTDNAGLNDWDYILVRDGGHLLFVNCNVEMAAKSNPAGGSTTNNAFSHISLDDNNAKFTFFNSVIKMVAGTNALQLTSSGLAEVAMRSVVLDGPGVALFRYASQGVAVLSTSLITLQNGAVLHSGDFTLGNNLIRN
jgi:hypothetical protein